MRLALTSPRWAASAIAAAVVAMAIPTSSAQAQQASSTACRPLDLKCRAQEMAKEVTNSLVGSAELPRGCRQNDNVQCARRIAVEERIDGAIGGDNQRQVFRFDLEQPGVLQLRLNPMPNRLWVQVTVTDAEQEQIDRYSHQAGQPGDRLLQLTAPGTYYVSLFSASGAPERFSFTVARDEPAAASPVPAAPSPVPTAPSTVPTIGTGCVQNDTFQCAQALAIGQRVDGAIGGGSQRLHYRIDLTEAGVLQVALNPMPNRLWTQVTISDAQYQRVERYSHQAGQPGERTIRIGAPGTYYVSLFSANGAPERFSLTIKK